MESRRIFINCSNHPSRYWSREQIEAAEQYGEVVDVRFPIVDPGMNEEEIAALAERMSRKILYYRPDAVMCQGEFTLTYAIVQRLKREKIRVMAACSKREVKEIYVPSGIRKEVIFRFERFREYVT